VDISKCQFCCVKFFLARASKLAIARISYGNSVLVSWCLFCCLSQPGTDQSPGDIETSGFHHMIVKSL